MRAVDLHTHSCRSDGTKTPTELVRIAQDKHLVAFALTDHDNVNGIEEVLRAAKNSDADDEYGIGIEAIPGIEFSTEYKDKDVHIVGLYYNYLDPTFQAQVKEFTDARDIRNEEMCNRLTEGGYPVDYKELCEAFPNAVITRAHFARFLLEKNLVKSLADAFDHLIGDDCPYFVPRRKISPQKAVQFLIAHHGIPILAHPFQYNLGDEGLEQLIRELKEVGLVGIEAYYCKHTPEMTAQIEALAKKYDLICSGGSDFHGENKPGLEMGYGYGHLLVPETCLTNMKHYLHQVNEDTKVFFFDFDGTLATSEKTISPATKKALDGYVERGNIFVFASGRSMPDVKDMAAHLGLTNPRMYFTAYNSGEIYDNDTGMTLVRETLSMDMVRRVFELAQECGLYVETFDDSGIVTKRECEESRYYTSFNHLNIRYAQDVTKELLTEPCKCLAISMNDTQKLLDFGKRIEEEFGGAIETTLSQPKYLEIVPKGIDKGFGVKWLCRYLGLPLENAYAAGDADNDIPMLLAAGTGVAMANAMTQNVFDAADVITTKDNDHDGLVPVLQSI